MITGFAGPGFYSAITAEQYFADPCPRPSLTQSLCKILLERSPLHAWYAHPRLNPDYAPSDDTKFDIGNIAHRLLLDKGKTLVVLPHEDWRKKEAREIRDAEAKRGNLAVLERHYAVAQAMERAAHAALEAAGRWWMFDAHGDSEAMIAWQSAIDGKGPLWCRQLLDWLSPDRTTYVDYKTTQASGAPHTLSRRMIEYGWPIQAAFAEAGLNAVFGRAKRRFLFVTQEATPPYALTVAELSEAALTLGRKQVVSAARLWERCLADNIWPAYTQEIVWPEYPAWAEAAWLERESHDSTGAAAPLTSNYGGGDIPSPDHFMGG